MTAPLQLFGLDFYALNFFVSLFGAGAVVLLYFHQRPRLGPGLSLLVAASVWLLPAYQKLCNQAMSDAPGLALLMGCLLLERASASGSIPWRRESLLGAAIGVAALVRSMNGLLLPAIVAARGVEWLRDRAGRPSFRGFFTRRAAVMGFAALLVLLPWAVRNQLVTPHSPADQVTVYDYSTGMWHRDPGDPASPRLSARDIVERIPRRALQLTHVIGSGMQVNANGNRPPDHPVALPHALASVALLAGLLYSLWKRWESAEFFAVAALLMMLVYFGFQNRLVLPVYVISFAATVELGRDMLARVAPPRLAGGAVALALLALMLLSFDPRAGWDRIRDKHLDLQNDSAAIAQHVGPGSCLAASAGFHYSLYLDRPVYSLQMAVRRDGGLQAVEGVIDRYGIDTLLVLGDKKMEKEILSYARLRYPPAEPVGSGFLFRVRPSSGECAAHGQ